jgi:DNA helicase-2/ATP-dependent DNA helicase PcrA
VGGIRFYDRAEVKDILAYLQVVDNPDNSIALQRIINTPRRGIGAKTLQTILDRARTEKISDFEALRQLAGEGAFPRGTSAKLMEFAACIDGWRKYARSHRPGDVLQLVLEETKYIASLGDPENLEVRSRTENLEELVNAVAQFEERHENATLQDYLENVTLVAVPADEPGEDESAASLLTLHSAKGLEFRVVFMVGLDDNIIPSPRAIREASGSLHGGGGVEEERRLFYVGITRAREVLFMTRCQSRMLYGDVVYTNPSMFLGELPHDVVEFVSDIYNFDFDELNRLLQTTGRAERAALPPRRETPGRPSLDTLPQPVDRPVRAGALQPGSRVHHPVLGDGIITGISGRGPGAKLVFQLEDGTCYTFLAQHANLQLVAD